jgi:hypothetical protein
MNVVDYTREDNAVWFSVKGFGERADSPAELIQGQLSWAVIHDMRDRVRLLAAHGADLRASFPGPGDRWVQCVNACDGRTPAEVAAVCGCWAVLDWLVEHGGVPRPRSKGRTG